jgi:hypothetical protein
MITLPPLRTHDWWLFEGLLGQLADYVMWQSESINHMLELLERKTTKSSGPVISHQGPPSIKIR